MCLKFKNHLPILRKYFLLYFIINLELFEIWSKIAAQFHVFRNGDSIVTAQLLKSQPAMQYNLYYKSSICIWVIFFLGSVYTHWLACLALCQECVLETCGAGPSTCVSLQACLEDIIVYAFSKNILECSYQCAPGKNIEGVLTLMFIFNIYNNLRIIHLITILIFNLLIH